MKLKKWIKSLLIKEYRVSYAGKETTLHLRRFSKKPTCSPQEYMDRHAVVCGNCGELMFPGEKIWLMEPKDDADCLRPGVLVNGEGAERALVGCLSWGCPMTAAMMCGELGMNRKISTFESPFDQALRTGEPVIISDVKTYGQAS